MRLFIFSLLLIPIDLLAQEAVFNPGDEIYYQAHLTNDSIDSEDTLYLEVTGKNWKNDPQNQKELIINYLNPDSAKFSGLPTIGWMETDTTGYVESESVCWFHPPRHNQYKILETAPFPRVEFPLHEGKEYSRMLVISEGWGEMSGKTIVWRYLVMEEFLDEGNKCWEISAKATPQDDPSKTNVLDFTFCKQKGFDFLNYTFEDGTEVEIQRIKRGD